MFKHGAYDWRAVFYNKYQSIKTVKFLISKGPLGPLDSHKWLVPLYLEYGIGLILHYYPEWLTHKAAEPYHIHRAAVIKLLSEKAIPQVVALIITFLSYDIPEISKKKMFALEMKNESYINPNG